MSKKKSPSTKVKSRMKELIHLLKKWNYEYFILNQPSVEDAVYDKKFKELQDLEVRHGFIFPNSPTQKAGTQIEKSFFPVKHQIPMLSLESTDNHKELEKFDQRMKKFLRTNKIEYLCELKIDGLSTSLHYQQGKLKRIVTRGDGWTGEDVSINLALIQDLPKILPPEIIMEKDVVEARGEVYMRKKEFQRLNKELEKNNLSLLANPRNAAAGTLRTLNPTQKRNLHFFAYQILGVKEINDQSNCLKKLSQWGFSVNPHYRLCQNLTEIQKYFQEIQNQRNNLDYEIDGIVIKVNNYDYYQKLGQTSRFPRWALAYKFPASIALSQIKDIQVEITRSGRVSYVAKIIPVDLLGSQINKSTLHNYGFIRHLNLNIGDQVVIKKAGDIIPQVIQVVNSGTKSKNTCWNPPINCPVCLTSLEWENSKESQERIYQFCPNEDCPERNIKLLSLFASKTGMDIKGVSETIIRKLYQINLLRTPVDFYYLEQKKPELLKLEGFQKKSVTNLLNSIEKSKKNSSSSLLSALGIPLLGKVKSQKLINLYGDLESFIQKIEKKDLSLAEKNLGSATTQALENYFYQTKNKKMFKELIKVIKTSNITQKNLPR